MKLALFTPSAALWPVLRNFDVFVASLAAPHSSARSIAASPLYPVHLVEAPPQGSAALERRLDALQQELYAALLRPSEHYAGMTADMAEHFWGDLQGTSVASLLDAFYFYFTYQTAGDLSVVDGLSVLRAVFFNHESTDPSLWLLAAERRLQGLRLALPQYSVELTAPPSVRLQDLAFAAQLHVGASTGSSNWLRGSLRRRPDGLVGARLECAMDAGAVESGERDVAEQRLRTELEAAAQQIFGWAPAEVAA
jgi:hypothetical protein